MRAVEGPTRGLVPFDGPVYLQRDTPDDGVAILPPAAKLRTAAWVGRLLLVVTIVGAAPSVHKRDMVETLGYTLAFIYLPCAAILDLIERRRNDHTMPALSMALDLSLFAWAGTLLDDPTVTSLGLLIVVAYHSYRNGRTFGIVGMLIVIAVLSLGPATDHGRSAIVAISAIAGGLLVFLLVDAAEHHDRARTSLTRIHDKGEAVLAGIGEAIVVTGPRGSVHEWNASAERIFNRSATHVIGQPCHEVLELRDNMRELRCDTKCGLVALCRKSGGEVQVWRHGPRDERQLLLASAQTIVDRDGEVVEVVHALRDISALRAADEAKTLFLATASHELKTPLTVIRGFAQMLQKADALDAEQQREAYKAIERRTTQLAGIVDRLLMSSRIDAGRVDLEPAVHDIGPLLVERAAAFQSATGREVSLDLAEDWVLAWVDQEALVTVIEHLLDNAVKYSPNGGMIKVRARQLETMTRIYVQDEGVGMTADQVDHCFERFWQAEGTDVRRFGGTGIGLYIVRSFVEAMNGVVAVSSAPGRGTTFTISLRTDEPTEFDVDEPATADEQLGQASMIREFMRQVGVPLSAGGGSS